MRTMYGACARRARAIWPHSTQKVSATQVRGWLRKRAFSAKLVDWRRDGGSMADDEQLKEEMERLKRENEALRAQNRAKPGQLTMKVSEKGAVSVYGLGRFPVTLYQEQWRKLLDRADEIRAFIEANESQLKKKDG